MWKCSCESVGRNARYHQISQLWHNFDCRKREHILNSLQYQTLSWLGRCTSCFALLSIVNYRTNTILFPLEKIKDKSKILFDPYSPLVTTIINLVCILTDLLSVDLHTYYSAQTDELMYVESSYFTCLWEMGPIIFNHVKCWCDG